MRKTIPVILLILILFHTRIYSNEKLYHAKNIKFKNNSYDVFIINTTSKIKFLWKNDDNNFYNFETVNNYFRKQNKKVIFAMNGGIYDKNYAPLGLYIENWEKLVDVNLKKDEPGNFYLHPNGIFLIDENNNAAVIKTDEYSKYKIKIKYAVQSGPLLVLNNNIHPAFNKNSTSKFIRNAVGITNNNKVIFVISNDPVNFYNFALFFKEKLKCNNALYLDGYVSKTYLPALNRNEMGGFFASIIAIVE